MAPEATNNGDESGDSLAAPQAAGREPLLVLEQVTKSFGAVPALSDGSIALHSGEAHALVGENGAGKSTLVKILAGVHRPDSGRITLDGKNLSLHGPASAGAVGIAVIYQEPTLFPDISVAENVFIGAPTPALVEAHQLELDERRGERGPGSPGSTPDVSTLARGLSRGRPADCPRSRRRSRSTLG